MLDHALRMLLHGFGEGFGLETTGKTTVEMCIRDSLQAVLGKIGVVVVLVGVLLEREYNVGAVLSALCLLYTSRCV